MEDTKLRPFIRLRENIKNLEFDVKPDEEGIYKNAFYNVLTRMDMYFKEHDLYDAANYDKLIDGYITRETSLKFTTADDFSELSHFVDHEVVGGKSTLESIKLANKDLFLLSGTEALLCHEFIHNITVNNFGMEVKDENGEIVEVQGASALRRTGKNSMKANLADYVNDSFLLEGYTEGLALEIYPEIERSSYVSQVKIVNLINAYFGKDKTYKEFLRRELKSVRNALNKDKYYDKHLKFEMTEIHKSSLKKLSYGEEMWEFNRNVANLENTIIRKLLQHSADSSMSAYGYIKTIGKFFGDMPDKLWFFKNERENLKFLTETNAGYMRELPEFKNLPEGQQSELLDIFNKTVLEEIKLKTNVEGYHLDGQRLFVRKNENNNLDFLYKGEVTEDINKMCDPRGSIYNLELVIHPSSDDEDVYFLFDRDRVTKLRYLKVGAEKYIDTEGKEDMKMKFKQNEQEVGVRFCDKMGITQDIVFNKEELAEREIKLQNKVAKIDRVLQGKEALYDKAAELI